MTQNQIAYWNLQETKRSNLVKEAETERSNLAKEKETERSNKADEQIAKVKIATDATTGLFRSAVGLL